MRRMGTGWRGFVLAAMLAGSILAAAEPAGGGKDAFGIWFQFRPDTICRALSIGAEGIIVRTWLVPTPGARAVVTNGGPGYILVEMTDTPDGLKAMAELGLRELTPVRLRAAGYARTDCWPGVGFASNRIKGQMIRLYRLNAGSGADGH